MKVLDIGSGINTSAYAVYPDLKPEEIVRLDINRKVKPDIRHDITKPLPKKWRGSFDAVVCNHMLEHVDRSQVIPVMENMKDAVKPLGFVWVIVPSLEWAANEIMNGRDGLGVQGILFGAQRHPFDYHRIGFTLNALAQAAILAGLEVEKQFQTEVIIAVNGYKYDAVQNVIKAVRSN